MEALCHSPAHCCHGWCWVSRGCGDVPPLPVPLFIQMKPLTALTWACREAFKCALKGGYNEKKTQSDLALRVTWLLLRCVCCVCLLQNQVWRIKADWRYLPDPNPWKGKGAARGVAGTRPFGPCWASFEGPRASWQLLVHGHIQVTSVDGWKSTGRCPEEMKTGMGSSQNCYEEMWNGALPHCPHLSRANLVRMGFAQWPATLSLLKHHGSSFWVIHMEGNHRFH